MPPRIGRYTIVRILGEGGMGTVYEAVQENPKRTVALKVIKAGYLSAALLRRFEQESQVLGRLQHPGIAQVYEAGVFANPERERRAASAPDDQLTPASTVPFGTPFFAMEFIKGVPLTDYATQKNLGTRDRLELLAKVCDAVYHAHQKGVIHRDLKPGNIIVDESGQPKILDFGVARATDSDLQQTTIQTDIGAIIGTVPYMSPEQVGGNPDDLDTRSDVYALGVIAYELLAGRLPYDLQRKMIHEAARIIREEEPTRLSSINRTLRGDIETIITHALEKDKVRRYQSAESLASDIRRYLKDEPIAARPASTWYQAAKFAKRNTGLVTGLAAAFILLIAGLAGTGYGLKQAITARDNERAARTEADIQRNAALAAKESEAKERKIAEAQRDKAEKIAEFMSETLQGAGPSVALGRDITMLKEMMDAAAARIEKGDLKDAPEAELRLRVTLGSTYRELAEFESSQRMLEPAVRIARSTQAGHSYIVTSLNNFALLLQDQNKITEAEALMREALQRDRAALPAGHPDIAYSLNNLAMLLYNQNKLAEAEPLFREALEIRRTALVAGHSETAHSLNNLATLVQAQNKLAEAEPLYREALEIYCAALPTGHPDIAKGLNNLAALLRAQNKLAEAEPLFREALDIQRAALPAGHPNIATGLNNLATLLKDQNKLAEAEPLLREALEIDCAALPAGHPDIAASLYSLASLLQAQNKLAEAEPLMREALQRDRAALPAGHPEIARSLNNLAMLLKDQNKLAEAEPLVREALEIDRTALPAGHPDIAAILNSLAVLLYAQNRLAEAEPIYREALEIFRATHPVGHPTIATGLNNLAWLLQAQNKLAEAEPLSREALEIRRAALPAGHPETLGSLYNLADLLVKADRAGEAAPLVEECVEGHIRTFGAGHQNTRRVIAMAVKLYESWDKAEPAKGYDAKAAEWKAKLDAVSPPAHDAKPPGG